MPSMKLVRDAVAETTVNLTLRGGPGTTYGRIITIAKFSKLRVVESPRGDWVKVVMSGWVTPDDPGRVYSDEHLKSNVKGMRSSSSWELREFVGFVSTRYLKIIDGPQ